MCASASDSSWYLGYGHNMLASSLARSGSGSGFVPVASAHGCFPLPVVVLVVLTYNYSILPLVPETLLSVEPDSLPMPMVSVSSFTTLVLVYVQICLPPAHSEYHEWIYNSSGCSVQYSIPTRMPKKPLNLRVQLLESAILNWHRAN